MISKEMVYKYACAIISSLFEQSLLSVEESIKIKKELQDRLGYQEDTKSNSIIINNLLDIYCF